VFALPFLFVFSFFRHFLEEKKPVFYALVAVILKNSLKKVCKIKKKDISLYS